MNEILEKQVRSFLEESSSHIQIILLKNDEGASGLGAAAEPTVDNNMEVEDITNMETADNPQQEQMETSDMNDYLTV